MMKMMWLPLLVLLAGCAGVSRYDAEGVTAYGGSPDEHKQTLYYSVGIDLMQERRMAMRLAIKFQAEEQPVALGTLDPEHAARHIPVWEAPPQWPDIVKQREKERLKGYEVFSGEGAYLKFKDGKLVYLGLCSHCEGQRFHPPQIGLADTGVTYSLPLTENQLRDIFGEPKRIGRQREIYY